jgi:putative redox protein
MPDSTIVVQSVDDSTGLGWAGARTVSIDRPTAAGGHGRGFSGGELFLLAIGGCYYNDLFREAAKLGIELTRVRVEVSADWKGEPVVAQNVRIRAELHGPGQTSELERLARHTDAVAEIPNSLRLGTPVALGELTLTGSDGTRAAAG